MNRSGPNPGAAAPPGAGSQAAPATPPAPSASDVARMMRGTLASTDFRTEGHRKAALRRLLHESVAGMDETALLAFAQDLRSRFPDRIFEAISRVRRLDQRLKAVEAEALALRTEVAVLRRKASSADEMVAQLYARVTGASAERGAVGASAAPGARAGAPAGASAEAPGGASSMSGSQGVAHLDDAALARLAGIVAELIAFALDQDSTTLTVEESLGRGQPAGRGVTLAELAGRIAMGEGRGGEDRLEMDRRLKRMRLLPAALLAGIQQSWKGGTRGVLEYLDPKAAEADVPARFPGLREAAVLKEVRRRYEQFWDELDKNIAHYYRSTFEKVYSEKMEGHS